jgi:hypothetical protein
LKLKHRGPNKKSKIAYNKDSPQRKTTSKY